MEVAWKEILNNIGYREWNGGECVVDNGNPSNENEEPAVTEEATPIEGCDGLVLDNLEENTTLEDIKSILRMSAQKKI